MGLLSGRPAVQGQINNVLKYIHSKAVNSPYVKTHEMYGVSILLCYDHERAAGSRLFHLLYANKPVFI